MELFVDRWLTILWVPGITLGRNLHFWLIRLSSVYSIWSESGRGSVQSLLFGLINCLELLALVLVWHLVHILLGRWSLLVLRLMLEIVTLRSRHHIRCRLVLELVLLRRSVCMSLWSLWHLGSRLSSRATKVRFEFS